jgi:hypothetical protein
MLFRLRSRDRRLLSRRSRAFIRVHHLAVSAVLAWTAYLFFLAELN